MIEGADFPLDPKIYNPDTMAGQPITVATLLWDRNEHSFEFSAYDESWVEKLFTNFRDKFSRPMRFIVFTDKLREFSTPLIEQRLLESHRPLTYTACLEPYELGVPMILVGLDTIPTGNCDELADYCFYGDRVAVPRDPLFPDKVCNGVALVPAGQEWVWRDRDPAMTDMDWIRSNAGRLAVIDDLFPGQVLSYKGTARKEGVGDARIVYFHGRLKPPELGHIGWIHRAWGGAI